MRLEEGCDTIKECCSSLRLDSPLWWTGQMMARFTARRSRLRHVGGFVVVGKKALICQDFRNELPRTARLPYELAVQQVRV